jgi:hypothetical protein
MPGAMCYSLNVGEGEFSDVGFSLTNSPLIHRHLLCCTKLARRGLEAGEALAEEGRLSQKDGQVISGALFSEEGG